MLFFSPTHQLGVAAALPGVETGPLVLAGDEPWVAEAVVAGVFVDAPTVGTQVRFPISALVHIRALLVQVDHHSLGAVAAERAHRVGAGAPLAQACRGKKEREKKGREIQNENQEDAWIGLAKETKLERDDF